MSQSNTKNAAHLALIRSAMFSLAMPAARVLYKCVLAAFVVSAKKAQPSAANVTSDLEESSTLSETEYLNALNNLGNRWERANLASRNAIHGLRCLDEATILGKMRASIPRYAAGGFDHAITSIRTGDGEHGEIINFEDAVEKAVTAVGEYKQEKKADTEGIPTERMGPAAPSLPSSPAEVVNYLVL